MTRAFNAAFTTIIIVLEKGATMGQIGEEEKQWDIPLPEQIPETAPAEPVREPEKVPA